MTPVRLINAITVCDKKLAGEFMITMHTVKKRTADLVGLAGALLIFFNWVWSSEVANRLTAASGELATARQEQIRLIDIRLLQRDLDDLKGMTKDSQLMFAEIYQILLKTSPANSDAELSARQRESALSFERQELSLERIDREVDECFGVLRLGLVDPISTNASELLQKTCKELFELMQEKEKLLRQVKGIVQENADRRSMIKTMTEQYALEDEVYAAFNQIDASISSKIPFLIERYVTASKQREEEFAKRLHAAQIEADRAQGIGFWLYVLGTSMLLLRTLLKEILPRRESPA